MLNSTLFWYEALLCEYSFNKGLYIYAYRYIDVYISFICVYIGVCMYICTCIRTYMTTRKHTPMYISKFIAICVSLLSLLT